MTDESHHRGMATLIDDYLAHLRFLRRSPRTITTYAGVLYHAHRELPSGLPTANRRELRNWLADDRRAVRTQRLYTTAIAGFFAWLVEEGHADWSPAANLPKPRTPHAEPRPATTAQVRAVLTATAASGWRAPTMRDLERVQLWSAIAVYSGARAREIAHLDRDRDITEHGLRLDGKGDRPRTVPLHPHLRGWLAGWPGPLCQVDERDVSRISWRIYRRLGLITSIHRFRSYYATALLAAGVDSRVVQVLLGHANPASTQAYLHVDATQLAGAVARLPVIEAAAGADHPAQV